MFKYVHLYVDLFNPPPPPPNPTQFACRNTFFAGQKRDKIKRTKRNKQTEPNEQKHLSQLNFKH